MGVSSWIWDPHPGGLRCSLRPGALRPVELDLGRKVGGAEELEKLFRPKELSENYDLIVENFVCALTLLFLTSP